VPRASEGVRTVGRVSHTTLSKQDKAAADLAKMMGWIERGVQNLSVSIDLVQADTYDTELSSEDMPDRPKAFEVLKGASPDKRPTLGSQAKFWALNFSDGSGPAPLPEKIRNTLTKAFDRVASWASEVRQGRSNAEKASNVAEALITSTEINAERVMKEARERGSKDAVIQGWRSFAELMKKKIRLNFGDDGYQQVADSVNEIWKTHDDNPNRPLPKLEPVSSSPSGP